MVKIVGSALILVACLGYAFSLTEKQKYHRDVLLSLIQIMELLAGEIRYERLTMADALRNLDKKYHGPAGSVMRRISDKLMSAAYEDLESVWCSVFREDQKPLMLSEEELDILMDTAKHLGYPDVETQMNHLSHCRLRLEKKLKEAQKDMEEKKKLYRYLALAAGVMVILVLL
ncbi:MAG: stage III sporulation protein AB [Lachnospiraceae bacterium]|nr:stage III sporulation protein AB [Lachnospiraceae bacterium]